jgi:hypothetical protein
MTSRTGPIYEVTFFVDRDIADDCDRWLEDHVRNVLRDESIIDCNVLSLSDDDEGRYRRLCLHVLKSDDALDDFLDGMGSDIESEIASRFDDRVFVSGRVLREDTTIDQAPGETPNCLNCGTRLRGQYCGTCGQRSRGRLISLWELISDAFGDLFEIDSRLWQTLIPLMIRPGRLTHDYLQGRRARYMPPFRMYLVLSLLFFVVAFFDPREELGLLFEPEPDATGEEIAADAQDRKQEILDELAEDGIIIGGELPEDSDSVQCEMDESDLDELPGWLSRRLTPERLKRICERTQIDDGRALLDKLLDNIPAALIVLLPLIALVLKALYPLSKRYYVEHLLFFVHFHAFFFLILSLQILFARLATMLFVPEPAIVLTLVVASFYVPVYLFVSMRRVYGQGRFVTFIKYIVLVMAYSVGFLTTMVGALAIAAFSI